MRNNLKVFFTTAWSTGAGTRVAVFIRSTQQEALDALNSYLAATAPDTYAGNSGVRYFLMNKNIITYVMALPGIGLALDPEFSTVFNDKETADAYNVESDFWQGTDPNDPEQERAEKAAESTLKTNRKGSQAAQFAVTLAQWLGLLYYDLTQKGYSYQANQVRLFQIDLARGMSQAEIRTRLAFLESILPA